MRWVGLLECKSVDYWVQICGVRSRGRGWKTRDECVRQAAGHGPACLV